MNMDDIELLDDYIPSKENEEEKEKKNKPKKEKKKKNKIQKEPLSKEKRREILLYNIKIVAIKVLFIVIIIYVMFFQIFGLTRINSLSMHPTIASGDLLIYYRLDKDYKVGDVVTFEKNGKRYVLRIFAIENQTVNLNSSNELINTKVTLEKETLFKDIIPENSKIKYPFKVEKGKVFVVGDYRLETDDSREFGTIDTSIIDGKVISLLQTKGI